MGDPDAPEYTPWVWNDTPKGCNCIQYACAGSNPDDSNRIFDEIPARPGETVGYPLYQPITAEHLFEGLQKDGIEVLPQDSNALPPKKEGYYLVGIYIGSDGKDFHFVRQDRDGGWSNMPGIALDADRFYPPGPNGEYYPLPEDVPQRDPDGTEWSYKLKGYAYIPKEGVDLGIEHRVAQDIQNCTPVDGVFAAKQEWGERLYQLVMEKYGDAPLNPDSCGITGGENATIADVLQKNYFSYFPSASTEVDGNGRQS